MAYTTPRTWVANETVTAALLNAHVRDNVAWLATDAPHCRVYNSANISIAVSGTPQALTFDSERYDVGGCHSTSTNTGRITIPSGAGGKWHFGCNVSFAANATGVRQVYMRLNGTTTIAFSNDPALGSGDVSIHNLSCDYAVSAGDYVEVVCNQTSGGALNVLLAANYSPEFWGHWVRT